MKEKLNFLLSLAVLIVFAESAKAQTGSANLQSYVKQLADSTYQKEKVPSIFIGVLSNGKRTYYNAGYAIPDSKSVFDSSTIFEIGSITKTFTAYVLTAVLNEQGIALTEPVLKYLPESVQQNKSLEAISFLSLLNHTSGLPRLPENMKLDSKSPYDNYTADQLFSYLKDCKTKPDGKSNYSNLGAGVAGVLAERISGKTYTDLVDHYIFQPFNMRKTENELAVSLKESIKSQGYFTGTEKIPYWNMNVLAPCGGLKCNSDEMLTYLQNIGMPEFDISKTIVDQLTTQTVEINERIAVGLGWHIINGTNNQIVYWHNGGTYGFSTFCAFLKDKNKAVMVVINQFNKNAVSDGLGFAIMKKMLLED